MLGVIMKLLWCTGGWWWSSASFSVWSREEETVGRESGFIQRWMHSTPPPPHYIMHHTCTCVCVDNRICSHGSMFKQKSRFNSSLETSKYTSRCGLLIKYWHKILLRFHLWDLYKILAKLHFTPFKLGVIVILVSLRYKFFFFSFTLKLPKHVQCGPSVHIHYLASH